VTGLTADTACASSASSGSGLDDMSVFARTSTFLGFIGNVILGFVLGTLGTTALFWFSGDIGGDVNLWFVRRTLRTAALFGFSGDVVLWFVFGTLRATALLGWYRSEIGWRGGLLSDFLGGWEDQVGDLLDEVISAAVGSGDIVRDVLNKVFDFFHDRDGEKVCLRSHDIRIK